MDDTFLLIDPAIRVEFGGLSLAKLSDVLGREILMSRYTLQTRLGRQPVAAVKRRRQRLSLGARQIEDGEQSPRQETNHHDRDRQRDTEFDDGRRVHIALFVSVDWMFDLIHAPVPPAIADRGAAQAGGPALARQKTPTRGRRWRSPRPDRASETEFPDDETAAQSARTGQ